MNHEKFRKMMAAARDIVHAADSDLALDPLTVQWARDLVAMNPGKKRGSPAMDRVLALFEADPMRGFQSGEIRKALNLTGASLTTMLHHLSSVRKLLFVLKAHGRSRYFRTPEAMEAGRAQFERDEQEWKIGHSPSVRRAKEPKEPKPPKEPKSPKPVPPPKPPKPPKPPRPPKTARKVTPFNPNTVVIPKATVLHSGRAFLPDHVQVQVIPTAEDYRYKVEAPADGFLGEWKRLRGEA